jgi:hypothetical protein
LREENSGLRMLVDLYENKTSSNFTITEPPELPEFI